MDVLQFNQTLWFSWVSLSKRLQRLSSAPTNNDHALDKVHPANAFDTLPASDPPDITSPVLPYLDPQRYSLIGDTPNVHQGTKSLPSTVTSHDSSRDLSNASAGGSTALSSTQPSATENAPDSEAERKRRKKEKRIQKHKKKIYLTPRLDDERRFRCPALVPPRVKTDPGKIQCSALHSRDGILDHLCVYFLSSSRLELNVYLYRIASHLSMVDRPWDEKQVRRNLVKIPDDAGFYTEVWSRLTLEGRYYPDHPHLALVLQDGNSMADQTQANV